MDSIQYSKPKSVKVKVSCNFELNVTVWKSSEGITPKPNCIFLHGLDNHSRVWDSLAETLMPFMNVYAIDFRGHGDSDWSHSSFYNRFRFTEDIDDVRNQLGLDKVYIVGHSLGASIACSYAVEFKQAIKGLVLCDMGLESGSEVLEFMRSEFHSRKSEFATINSYLEYLKTIYFIAQSNNLKSFGQHSIKKINDGYKIKNDPKCLDSLILELIEISSASCEKNQPSHMFKIVSKLRCPLLILKAQYSSSVNLEVAEKLISLNSQSKIRVIKKSGHAVMLDNPEETNSSICEFLNELESSSVLIKKKLIES